LAGGVVELGQGQMNGALAAIDVEPLAVGGEAGAGAVGHLPAHAAAHPADAGHAELVVGGGVMAKPRHGGELGPLFEGDAGGAGDGAAADGGGVGGDGLGEGGCDVVIARRKGEEVEDGLAEGGAVSLFFAGALRLAPGLILGMGGAVAQAFEVGPRRGDVAGRCPES